MSAAVIRAATEEDLDELLAIESSWKTTPGWSARQFEEELGRLLIAEYEGRLAGYACLWCVPPEAQLAGIAVRPSCARQGIGRLLLHAVMGAARGLDCSKLGLEVSARNDAALGLYASEGFRVVGRRPKYYKDGSDALLMDKDL